MQVNTIKLPLSCIANAESVWAIDITELKKYENGKIITDEIVGYRVTCICPHNKFQNFSVKFGNKPSISLEDIEKNEGKIEVKFINFEAKLFLKDGQIGISAKADKMIAVQ